MRCIREETDHYVSWLASSRSGLASLSWVAWICNDTCLWSFQISHLRCTCMFQAVGEQRCCLFYIMCYQATAAPHFVTVWTRPCADSRVADVIMGQHSNPHFFGGKKQRWKKQIQTEGGQKLNLSHLICSDRYPSRRHIWKVIKHTNQ